jgi:hypothetical protein
MREGRDAALALIRATRALKRAYRHHRDDTRRWLKSHRGPEPRPKPPDQRVIDAFLLRRRRGVRLVTLAHDRGTHAIDLSHIRPALTSTQRSGPPRAVCGPWKSPQQRETTLTNGRSFPLVSAVSGPVIRQQPWSPRRSCRSPGLERRAPAAWPTGRDDRTRVALPPYSLQAAREQSSPTFLRAVFPVDDPPLLLG